MEAEVGIEPAYTELQSAAWPLCHSALRIRIDCTELLRDAGGAKADSIVITPGIEGRGR